MDAVDLDPDYRAWLASEALDDEGWTTLDDLLDALDAPTRRAGSA